jgi:hypothetical protein
MIEEDKKVLINISKKWSNRFLKMMHHQRNPESNECEVIETTGNSDIMVAEDYSNFFSEP